MNINKSKMVILFQNNNIRFMNMNKKCTKNNTDQIENINIYI